MPHIIHEQPLNECIRICLILEQLFLQTHHDIKNINNIWQTKNAVNNLIKIIVATDRPDLQSKITKALGQQATSLSILENNPQVDQTKLAEVISEIDHILDELHTHNNRQQLKESSILKAILQYSSTPGGATNFNIPAFYLWLNQPHEQQKIILKNWLASFATIESGVNMLLKLLRNSQKMTEQDTDNGFFQRNLATNPVTQMIRVQIISDPTNIWPEISVGRHRLAIYFNDTDSNLFTSHIKFKLACCY
jgi:cell division protein ZapD